MKAKESLKMFVLTAALLVVSLATSARSYDNQLIYNRNLNNSKKLHEDE